MSAHLTSILIPANCTLSSSENRTQACSIRPENNLILRNPRTLLVPIRLWATCLPFRETESWEVSQGVRLQEGRGLLWSPSHCPQARPPLRGPAALSPQLSMSRIRRWQMTSPADKQGWERWALETPAGDNGLELRTNPWPLCPGFP